jgi:hypothetical protein
MPFRVSFTANRAPACDGAGFSGKHRQVVENQRCWWITTRFSTRGKTNLNAIPLYHTHCRRIRGHLAYRPLWHSHCIFHSV